MSIKPYVLSIEPIEGDTFRYPFHLGTDLRLARKIAEEKFAGRNLSPLKKDLDGRVMKTRTVALFQGAKMIDVFDGTWSSGADNQLPE